MRLECAPIYLECAPIYPKCARIVLNAAHSGRSNCPFGRSRCIQKTTLMSIDSPRIRPVCIRSGEGPLERPLINMPDDDLPPPTKFALQPLRCAMALKLLVALAAFSGAAAFAPSASMLPLSARRSVRASLGKFSSPSAGVGMLKPSDPRRKGATPRHATTPRHPTPRHATPRHATPRHATPRRAAPRHCIPRHAITPPTHRAHRATSDLCSHGTASDHRDWQPCGTRTWRATGS